MRQRLPNFMKLPWPFERMLKTLCVVQRRYYSIEVVRMPWLERFEAWCIRNIFKNNFDSQLLTAFWYPISLAFEWRAWRKLRRSIFAGEFDVVLRVLPMSPSLASPIAFFLRKGPIPLYLARSMVV